MVHLFHRPWKWSKGGLFGEPSGGWSFHHSAFALCGGSMGRYQTLEVFNAKKPPPKPSIFIFSVPMFGGGFTLRLSGQLMKSCRPHEACISLFWHSFASSPPLAATCQAPAVCELLPFCPLRACGRRQLLGHAWLCLELVSPV